MSTEGYRAGNTALLEALMDMVLQHCCSPVDDLIRHRYISSNEAAVAILEKAGMVKDDKLDWAALEARKATPPASLAASPAPADAGEPDMRHTLVVQIHNLIDVAERYSRHMHKRGDADERDRIDGEIAHARKVVAPYAYNGPTRERAKGTPQPDAGDTVRALAELVRLKDLKDSLYAVWTDPYGYVRPVLNGEQATRARSEYIRCKAKAWEAARKALAPAQADKEAGNA